MPTSADARFGATLPVGGDDVDIPGDFTNAVGPLLTLAARVDEVASTLPVTHYAKRFVWVTSTGVLYYDNGTTYTVVRRGLSGSAPAASAFGDAAVIGSSTNASPADHRHAREASPVGAMVTTSGLAFYDGAGIPALFSSSPQGREAYYQKTGNQVQLEAWQSVNPGGGAFSSGVDDISVDLPFAHKMPLTLSAPIGRYALIDSGGTTRYGDVATKAATATKVFLLGSIGYVPQNSSRLSVAVSYLST